MNQIRKINIKSTVHGKPVEYNKVLHEYELPCHVCGKLLKRNSKHYIAICFDCKKVKQEERRQNKKKGLVEKLDL